MSRKLVVEIVGDASSLERSLRATQVATGGLEGSFRRLAKAAAGLTGLGAITGALKVGYDEWSNHARVAAQTEAALRSTGRAAGVTARQIQDLAGALMRKSGIDDEEIQSGENMLLTFRNIHDAAGRGNDIFTQSTKAVIDMTAAFKAMGKETSPADMALQLGKALNDPAQGMTRLQRIGVTFSEAQKKAAKAMEEAGNMAGAQKVILAELNKEFGGSAEAAGRTLPGQIDILRQSFRNLAGDIVARLAPTLQSVVTWTTEHWPQISTVVSSVFGAIGHAMNIVIGIVRDLIGVYERHKTIVDVVAAAIASATIAIEAITVAVAAWTFAQTALDAVLAANPIGIVIVALAALAGGLVAAYEKSRTFREIVQAAFHGVETAFRALETAGGDTLHFFERLPGEVGAAARAVADAVTGAFGAALGWVRDHWREVASLISGPFGPLVALATNAFGIRDALVGALKGMLSAVADAASSIGEAIVHGIESGFGGLLGELKRWVEEQLKRMLKNLWPFSPVEHGGALYIGEPLAQGAISGYLAAIEPLGGVLSGSLRSAVTGTAAAPAVVPSTRAGGAAPDGDLVIQVSGETLARVARRELIRLGRANVDIFAGYA